jgi:hypothetical protein
MKSTGNAIAKVTDKAVTGLFRYAVTDHLGVGKRFLNMPAMGFLDTVRYLALTLVSSLIAAVVMGGLYFVLIAFGLPFLLLGHL